MSEQSIAEKPEQTQDALGRLRDTAKSSPQQPYSEIMSSIVTQTYLQAMRDPSPVPSPARTRQVVIVGGGVIGACIAFFLTLKGVCPIVIERCQVAAAASGKAGGFLARNWTDGTSREQLCHMSFDLHAQLADALDGSTNYQFRRLDTLGVQLAGPRVAAAPAAAHQGEDEIEWGPNGAPPATAQDSYASLLASSELRWVDGQVQQVRVLGRASDTAQVWCASVSGWGGSAAGWAGRGHEEGWWHASDD
jgi:hypothetical protein